MIRGDFVTVGQIRLSVSLGTLALSEAHRVQWGITARRQRLLLISADALLLVLAFLVAKAVDGAVRWPAPSVTGPEMTVATLGLGGLWLLSLRVTGAYSTRLLRSGSDEYRRTINASMVSAGVFGIVCFLLRYDYPRLTFVLWIVGGVVVLALSRYVRRQIMHRLHLQGLFQTPVLVAGSGHHIADVAQALRRERWSGFSLVGALTNTPHQSTETGLPVLGTFDEILDVISERQVATVIFTEGSFGSPAEFRRLAWKLEQCQVQMMVVPTLADVSAERLEFSPMAGLPLVNVARPRALNSLRWFKRTADILGSSVLLLAAAPIMLAAALSIKALDGGPVLFRQSRIGLNGRPFNCWKFRSMCVDAESRMAALRQQNEGVGPLFKMTQDPRITRTGRFIRRFSIDELPQLWNTLRGDMSLVGPRPALPEEVARYDDDTKRRLQVRPGLTGLWQVSGRSSLSWDDTVRLDLYYVDNWSLVNDFMILTKTARAVLGCKGAY